jgi:hypothetical protein
MNHSFADYLMYIPPFSSQWVPLGYMNWYTHGNATIPSTNNWADYAAQNGSDSAGAVSPASQSFTPSNQFPGWHQVITPLY